MYSRSRENMYQHQHISANKKSVLREVVLFRYEWSYNLLAGSCSTEEFVLQQIPPSPLMPNVQAVKMCECFELE